MVSSMLFFFKLRNNGIFFFWISVVPSLSEKYLSASLAMPVLDVTRSGLWSAPSPQHAPDRDRAQKWSPVSQFPVCPSCPRTSSCRRCRLPVSLRAVLRAGRLNRFGLGQLMTGMSGISLSDQTASLPYASAIFRSASCSTHNASLTPLSVQVAGVAAGRHRSL